jgi:hypothetical protein
MAALAAGPQPQDTILVPTPDAISFTFPDPSPGLDDIVGEDRQVRYVLTNRYDIDPLTPAFLAAAPDTFTFLSCLLHVLDDPGLTNPRTWLNTPDPLLGVSPREYLASPQPSATVLLRDTTQDPDGAGLSPHTAALLGLFAAPPATLLPATTTTTLSDFARALTGVS